MDKNALLNRYIPMWYEHQKFALHAAEHLQEGLLFAMALRGGLATADPSWVNHLSLCPVCMDKWNEICNILDSEEEFTGREVVLGTGTLKAASGDRMEKLKLNSECGMFTLTIFPSRKDNGGTVVLNITNRFAGRFEGRTATVCDAVGEMIIQGAIREGSLARKVKQIEKFDFKEWNVIVALYPETDAHE